MPKGILVIDVTCNYNADLVREMINAQLPVKVIAISERIECQPDNLDYFIKEYGLNSFCVDDLYRPERFEKIFDPCFEEFNIDFFESIAYYKDLFLIMTDRNSFFPISAISRSRLFNQYLSHFTNIIRKNNIDTIIFFGTPHGPWSIALWGLAKSLNLNVMYTSPVEISTEISTIETDIKIERQYDNTSANLGQLANSDSFDKIQKIFKGQKVKENFTKRYTNRKMMMHTNIHKKYLKSIASLTLKNPLSEYISPEFDLNINKRIRVTCAIPLLKHYLNVLRALNFYKKNSTKTLPDKKSIVLFLHMQPEASVNPLGGYFNDQLFVFDLILAALPNDMNVFVKEHPWQFETIGEDIHERSIDFYKYLIKDKRVKLVDRSITSDLLIKNAGIVMSTCGTVCWESILIGKPSIAFGWSWFTSCKSCFVVDSVEKLKKAIKQCRLITKEEVFKNRDEFISELEKRIIYGIHHPIYLRDMGEDFNYAEGVKNIANALKITSKKNFP